MVVMGLGEVRDSVEAAQGGWFWGRGGRWVVGGGWPTVLCSSRRFWDGVACCGSGYGRLVVDGGLPAVLWGFDGSRR